MVWVATPARVAVTWAATLVRVETVARVSRMSVAWVAVAGWIPNRRGEGRRSG